MTNAGRTRSFGGEASLLATLWRNLDLQVAYGYTRATFVKFDTGKADYAGNFIPYAPQHTLYAGASYTLRTGWNWLEYVIFRWLPTVRAESTGTKRTPSRNPSTPCWKPRFASNTATGPSMSGDAT